jgi:menaquinone-dependent protoporphyrinogen oxidase
MKILVAVASRHGATAEIAAELGAVLEETVCAAGLPVRVDVADVRVVPRLGSYQAVVLGSAVYQSQWLPAADRFVDRHRAELLARPVWLFSSGPVGHPPRPAELPADGPRLAAAVAAQGHRVFPGRLCRRDLGPVERLITALMAAPDGDYRDWPAVHAWAREIGSALGRLGAPADPSPRPSPVRRH